MGRINSKKKGNRAERVVCSIFKEWTGWEFSRVPQSGGLRWKNRRDIAGDVICTEEGIFWPISIECKSSAEFKLIHELAPYQSKLDSYWEQASSDAKASHKIPMLFVRYNGLPKQFFFVIMEFKFAKEIGLIPKLENRILTKTSEHSLLITTSTELMSSPFEYFYVSAMAYIGKDGKKYL